MSALPSRRLLAACACVVLTASGCAFQGINSLPLPGAAGRGSDAHVYHVEIANVSTLESNSPVLMNDVVVGSVGAMRVKGWHAEVDVSVQPDVVVPANVVASVGQTSLLGSMHVELNPPLGQPPRGQLPPGATIGLNASSTYPTTEQTLSSLSVVVNAGGLGQLGDVVHTFNAALSGRQGDFRDLLTQLDAFVGTLDQQRQSLVGTIDALNRIATTFAGRRDVIEQALQRIPRALEVLDRERPNLTTALTKLGTFSDTANRLVNDTQSDLVTNLQNLQPTLQALADVGPDLDASLAYATVFPYGQNLVDRAVRGDFINLFATIDLSGARLRKSLFLGTRAGQEGRDLVPLPGEPYFQRYTYDPLGRPLAPPPPGGPLGPIPGNLGNAPTPGLQADPPGAAKSLPGPGSLPAAPPPPLPPVTGPVLPVVPQDQSGGVTTADTSATARGGPLFAGPYGAPAGGGS
ncbi:virulence factor Mce [Mycolicibacterium madagascariense]|uniref:Virulence factor Mce n=2 Tax=Mycolicibacterium madagascariense TaxID=212765 RepID=A0A7I7XK61_9MYCO|nr:MCE family protein [Mycolicibacterium madagascariense]MCV7012092.1 MCE family protein [Mycolicibacterium madagascariense]BBZ29601.1 virulence factor Mce [Mycolicibacterium madagascariense]